MPIAINGGTYYRTAEVCRLADISRATLFRWLKAGLLGEPEIRDRRGWRLYTQEQVDKIRAEAGKTTTDDIQKEQEYLPCPNILVVDDEPLIGRLFQESLEGHNYNVDATISSYRAVDLMQNKRYDLIFLDLLMPEINGAELFRQIRKRYKDVQVVIITGFPDSTLLDQALQYGPLLVMKKPFDTVDILETVRRFSQ